MRLLLAVLLLCALPVTAQEATAPTLSAIQKLQIQTPCRRWSSRSSGSRR
jgi:hypothetical protein